MRRKPARKLLISIARLRSTLRRSRRRLCRLLAERPAASHNTARPAQDRTYGPVFDHLDAELAIVERDLAAAEDNLAAKRVRPIQLRGRRDRDATWLADLYTPIRRLLGGLPIKGAEILAAAPDSPEALAYHMTLAADVLRALEREPPWPVGGVRVDAGVLADELEDGQRTLEASLRALDHSEWDVAHARCEADRAFARRGGDVLGRVDAGGLDRIGGGGGVGRADPELLRMRPRSGRSKMRNRMLDTPAARRIRRSPALTGSCTGLRER